MYTYDVYIWDSESGISQPIRVQAASESESQKLGRAYIRSWNLKDARIERIVRIDMEEIK